MDQTITDRIPEQGHPVKHQSDQHEPCQRIGRRLYVGTAGLYLRFVAPLYRTAGDLRVVDLAGTTGRGGDHAA